MLSKLLSRLIPSSADRTAQAYASKIARVRELSAGIHKLDSQALRQAAERHRLQAEPDPLYSLALAREAAAQALGLHAYDVQLMAALALLDGRVAEMRTGEGKTLAAVLAVCAAAITRPGAGVHVATANEYLAKRDAEAMGPVFAILGLTAGATLPGMSPAEKRAAYACDVVYGSSTEFALDYLHDNLVASLGERVQGDPVFAIVDEADSVLIDGARRPVVMSGPAEASTDVVPILDRLPAVLSRQADVKADGDYWIDEAQQSVIISESGYDQIEAFLSERGVLSDGRGLYAPENAGLVYAIHAALRAHGLFQRDRHYIVKDGEVVLISELTGRTLPGSRLEEGLHQALEAKEGLPVRPASQPYAIISMQNYFRRYEKLAGMTGTAETEALELQQVYGLKVAVIPTRRPCIRRDHDDLIYMTADAKWAAIVKDIAERHGWGQPVLVGTGSVEDNARLSQRLTAAGLPHQVLNAKDHASEAEVIARAGVPGAITLAASMAGRGTDIILGGDLAGQIALLSSKPGLTPAQLVGMAESLRREWEVLRDQAVAAGGLYVIGTERYESRRVDNQLRGRGGRQGDPGESRFYLSLEDHLLQTFPSQAIRQLAASLSIPDGEALEHRWASKAVAAAQRQMEARNYNLRKQMLDFDNVVAAQRQAVYAQRNEILGAEDVAAPVAAMRRATIAGVFDAHIPEGAHEADWSVDGLERVLLDEFSLSVPAKRMLADDKHLDREGLRDRVLDLADRAFQAKEAELGAANMRMFERLAMLQVLDRNWRGQLASLEQLQLGIHLRSYANKDPKHEFTREAFELFERMLDAVSRKVTTAIYTVEMRPRES